MVDDLELKKLNQYCGTEHYHKVFMNVTTTDGIVYVMNNGYSWFISDAVVIIKMNEKVKSQEFISVMLKVFGNTAHMIITDGNENILYTQDYKWTNAKRDLQLFYTNDVLMLSGEY